MKSECNNMHGERIKKVYKIYFCLPAIYLARLSETARVYKRDTQENVWKWSSFTNL